MFKKILSLTVLTLGLLLLSTNSIHAIAAAGLSDLESYCNDRSGDVVNLETWYSGKCLSQNVVETALTAAGASLQSLIYNIPLLSSFAGDLPLTTTFSGPHRGFADIVFLDLYGKIVGEDPNVARSLFGYNPDGVLPVTAGLIAQVVSTPPASSLDYLASIGQNIQSHSLVKPAYAQESVGFMSLRGVLVAWRGLRNIAYSIYILLFLLYGFMIMFRVKLDPKVVTSFELAIPKLIATLLLITFSYAIAGLLIDFMYVISLVIGVALEEAGLIKLRTADVGLNASDYLTGNGYGMVGFALLLSVKMFLTDSVDQITALILGLPTLVTSVLGFLSGFSLIIKLILVFALAYIMFKIFFMFIQAYAKIMLSIIFSPLILLGNVLPGNDSFGTWIRGLFAEMSVFPTTIILMMIASSFIDTGFFGLGGGDSTVAGDLWLPPGLGGAWATSAASGASALLGYSILMLIPKTADMIKDSLKVPPFKYGQALGEPLTFGYDVQARYAAGGYKYLPVSDRMKEFMARASKAAQNIQTTKQVTGPDAGKPIKF